MAPRKPKAVWCDLDGTLANIEHRLPLLEMHKDLPYEERMDIFTSHCEKDSVNKWCFELIWSMKVSGHDIVYVTGRSDKYMEETLAWLLEYVKFPGKSLPLLYMREKGDYTKDALLKKKLLRKIQKTYNIIFALEDRPSVCRMLRECGVVCLQVDDKEF